MQRFIDGVAEPSKTGTSSAVFGSRICEVRVVETQDNCKRHKTCESLFAIKCRHFVETQTHCVTAAVSCHKLELNRA
jgi:hypothetical protein